MPTLDLTPAALAVQARKLVQSAVDEVDATLRIQGLRYSWRDFATFLPWRIAAALGAVCDAARAEGDVRLAAAAELFRHIREAAGVAEPVDAAMLPGIVENLARERAECAKEVQQLRDALIEVRDETLAAWYPARVPTQLARAIAQADAALVPTELSHG